MFNAQGTVSVRSEGRIDCVACKESVACVNFEPKNFGANHDGFTTNDMLSLVRPKLSSSSLLPVFLAPETVNR